MNNLWKKTSSAYESSAKVVDGNLILSLPNAINPIVWRMELGNVKASALEVRTNTTDGTHVLTLKTPKGDVHDIAPFAQRDDALRALMRVSSALQGAQGKMSAINAATAPTASTIRNTAEQGSNSGYKWLLTLGGVLIVIILFAYLSSLTPQQMDSADIGMQESATSVTGESNAESGVPQSADQALRGF